MDSFSLSVGALAIIDACLKYGKALIKLYDDYKSAEAMISETLLKLKVIWHKIETQMAFLQKIWDTLDGNFQSNQVLLPSNLERKLQEAIRLLNSVIGTKSEPGGIAYILSKRGSVRKGKYVLGVNDSLDKSLSELMEWRSLFDPSWYLLSRVANSDVDRSIESHSKEEPLKFLSALRKSVRDLSSDNTMSVRPISSRDFLGSRLSIAASPLAVAQIEGRIQYGVVNTMPVNPNMDPTGTTRSVMALSKALSRMDPDAFGLLRCCGVVNKTDTYEFVFEIPQGFESPRSLRDLLTHSTPSLNLKLDIAKQLARSVFYLHTAGFVHKNIRPDTILVFDHGRDKSSFLLGFENFRGVKDDTFRIGDNLPERELYRHPLRQGNDPERRYIMQHDIYSLGVCLLEIGLWESFVKTDGIKTVVEFEPQESTNDTRKRAFAIKKQILVVTKERLSQYTGVKFKDIVEKCLTCLDDDATWSQVDNTGASDTGVGIDFIENVLVQLQEIVV